MSEYILALTTFESAAQAEPVVSTIVEERLAACAQVMAISSTYVWKGEIERSSEVLVIFKTRGNRYSELQGRLIDLHPYETPELVCTPITGGFAPYLAWIDENTGLS